MLITLSDLFNISEIGKWINYCVSFSINFNITSLTVTFLNMFFFHNGDLSKCKLYCWEKVNHIVRSFVFYTYKGTPPPT